MMIKELRNQENPEKDIRGSLDAKLLTYCAVAGGALLAAQPADAAIVYSGLKNLSLSDNKTVGVDLDSNGVVDFSFLNIAGRSTFTTQKTFGTSTVTYTHDRNFQSNILNLGGNLQNALAHKGPVGIPFDPAKVKLSPGSEIPGEGMYWLEGKKLNDVPLSYHAASRIFTSTMTSGTVNLNKGGGAFFNKTDFLGVRFQIDNDTHFGWIQYAGTPDTIITDNSTANDTLKATIVDWAYEDIPLTPIYAEQTPPPPPPPPQCTVTLTPGRISKALSLIMPVKGIIIQGQDNATFTKDTEIDWGSDSVTTLFKIRLKNTIFALVRVRPLLLQGAETFVVTVGDCIGELNVAPL